MNIQNFLETIDIINKKYQSKPRIPGENYNIFQILKVESQEVKLHSAFLANLLDSKGSHGQGNSFFKIFVREFNITGFEDLGIADVNVNVEENIGEINDEDSTGGRIDIVIKSKNRKIIVIENKIYAKDQKMQLVRYHNKYPNAHLLYLTLDGSSPSKISIEKNQGESLVLDKDYYCISYEKNILEWLKKCQLEIQSPSLVHTTISQYINLIKYLTNQTMEEKEKQEIVSMLISNPGYMNTIKSLFENDIWYETRKNIMLKLKEQLLGNTGIASELGLKEKHEGENFGKKEYGFWFYREDWKYCIYFYFEDEFETINYGIDVVDANKYKRDPSEKIKFETRLIDFGEKKNDDIWIWKSKFEEYENTSWFDLISTGRSLFKNKTEEILRKVEDLMIDRNFIQ